MTDAGLVLHKLQRLKQQVDLVRVRRPSAVYRRHCRVAPCYAGSVNRQAESGDRDGTQSATVSRRID